MNIETLTERLAQALERQNWDIGKEGRSELCAALHEVLGEDELQASIKRRVEALKREIELLEEIK